MPIEASKLTTKFFKRNWILEIKKFGGKRSTKSGGKKTTQNAKN